MSIGPLTNECGHTIIEMESQNGLFCSCHNVQNSPTTQDWVGLYIHIDDELLVWMVKGCYLKELNYGPIHFDDEFIGNLCRCYVGSYYLTLTKIWPDWIIVPSVIESQRWLLRVQVGTLV